MPVKIRGQFQRSVQIVRDFYGPRDLGGYVVTSKALETTGRIADGLASPGTYRAWSISGPYGGGKSSYALFLSRLLQGDTSAVDHLAAADSGLAERLQRAAAGPFVPILVVGSRGPITRALADGLAESLEAFAAGLPEERGRKATVARAAALAGEARLATTEPEVVGVYDRAAALVHERTGGGLLLVVDELGKHLEYAALHPGDGDPFVLQSLAERTGSADTAPLALFTVLHQAFERYAVGLSTEQREAWVKVQGRFEEVAFVEPVGETLRLLAAAIEADVPEAAAKKGERAINTLLKEAKLPGRLDAEAVADRLRASLPLHPSVALLVGPLFRRLAQNERSLFSFLASGEPRSFLDVVGTGAELYRLDHLYDYLTSTLGGALYHEGAGRLWAEAETALTRVAGDALQERVLKQTAVLSFAGSLAGLPPSEAVLLASSGAPKTKTRAALDALREARAVAYRSHHKEYRVWEGSDFDVSGALAEARKEIPLRTTLARLLARAAPPEPLVARRHAFRTGTHRVFEVVYTDEAGWRTTLDAPLGQADGRISYVLPERGGGAELVEEIAAATGGGKGLRLFCVLDGVAGLADLARDVAALDWVRENVPALEGDKTARREVDEQRAEVRAALDHRLSVALAPSGGTWVRSGETFRLADDELQARLSDVCDRVFSETPRIRSELLNRHRPSSSAVRALKLLLQAMAEHEGERHLGIEGTPAEYALYVSVLHETGLHREADGGWAFADADGVDPGSAAVVQALGGAIERARESPVPVPDLYDLVRAAPYGVRDGLLPVFLSLVLTRLGDDVALFEDGVYQWSLSYEAVERLLRVPASFSVQSVGASPAQAAAIETVAPRVGLPDGAPLKPLPVVGRILQAVSGLPAYVRRTESLSTPAMAVREALVHATEPAALLFRELPAAVGLDPFGDGAATRAVERRASEFADALSDALRELAAAYDDLLSGVDAELAAAFDLREQTPDGRRDELADRARALSDDRVDSAVRSFVVRASDDLADTRAWTESLAALLARTPPLQWSDADRERFSAALGDVSDAFRSREAVHLSASDVLADKSRTVTKFRLRVTSTHEEELDTLLTVHTEDEEAVRETARDLAATLDRSGRSLDTQLAALSQLSLALIQRRKGGEGTIDELLAALQAPPDDDLT